MAVTSERSGGRGKLVARITAGVLLAGLLALEVGVVAFGGRGKAQERLGLLLELVGIYSIVLGLISRTKVLGRFENLESDLTSGNAFVFLRANFILLSLLFLFSSAALEPPAQPPTRVVERKARVDKGGKDERSILGPLLWPLAYLFAIVLGLLAVSVMTLLLVLVALISLPGLMVGGVRNLVVRRSGDPTRGSVGRLLPPLWDAFIASWQSLGAVLRNFAWVLIIMLVVFVFGLFHLFVLVPVSYLAYLLASRVTDRLANSARASELGLVAIPDSSRQGNDVPSPRSLTVRELATEGSLAFKSFLVGIPAILLGLIGRAIAVFT